MCTWKFIKIYSFDIKYIYIIYFLLCFYFFFTFQGQNVYFNVEKWLNDTIKVIETTDKNLILKIFKNLNNFYNYQTKIM